MEQKIAELTQKLYKEGIEKGEEQKLAIIRLAEEQANKIRLEAQQEAAKIISNAQDRASDLKRNSESEIKLSALQALNSLKQNIIDVIVSKNLEQPVTNLLSQKDVLKEIIIALVKNWKSESGQSNAFELLLPEVLRDSLDKTFEESLKNTLKEAIVCSFSKNIKAGFQIKPTNSSYKLSFSDVDFNTFLKEYLRPKTRTFLFGE